MAKRQFLNVILEWSIIISLW